MPLIDELLGDDPPMAAARSGPADIQGLYEMLVEEGTDLDEFVAEGMRHIDEIGVFEVYGMKLRTQDQDRLLDINNQAAVEAALMAPGPRAPVAPRVPEQRMIYLRRRRPAPAPAMKPNLGGTGPRPRPAGQPALMCNN